MTRLRPRAVALFGAALIVGVALAGCGPRRPAATSAAPYPVYAASQTPDPSGAADSGSGEPGDPSSASPASLTSPATPDPAASELDQINQLINDINNSIQDSSNGGGE